MNKKQRQLYSQRDQRRKKLFEKKYVKQVNAALKQQLTEAATILRASGVDGLKLKLANLIFIQDLATVILDLWQEVGVYYGNKTLRDINTSIREEKAGFGLNDKWIRDILEYFARFLLAKAVLPISETTKQQILSIITKGEQEGWGIDQMVYELENSDITLGRARLIVRTELVMAQNYGQQLAKKESIYELQEEWISADDLRTRKSHQEVDGMVINEGGRFRVPRYKGRKLVGYDMMNGPGDPTAHAENICNCRCTKSITAKRDKKGNLIRKRTQVFMLPGGPFAPTLVRF